MPLQGVEEMRRQMETWFPMVHLIATTSASSKIHEFGPEARMTPEEVTRAFLAIRELNEKGLAARMM